MTYDSAIKPGLLGAASAQPLDLAGRLGFALVAGTLDLAFHSACHSENRRRWGMAAPMD